MWLPFVSKKKYQTLVDKADSLQKDLNLIDRNFVDLSKECARIMKQRDLAIEECKSPTKAIEAILKRGIEWYRYQDLPEGEQLAYYQRAQGLLNDDVLMNEIRHLIADTVKELPHRSKDLSEVRALGWLIIGVDSIRERLESILAPGQAKQSTTEDIHSPI